MEKSYWDSLGHSRGRRLTRRLARLDDDTGTLGQYASQVTSPSKHAAHGQTDRGGCFTERLAYETTEQDPAVRL